MRGEDAISQDNPPTSPFSSSPSRLTPSLFPELKGFIETSFVDWPGKLCAIMFVGGCNFRCPFCHNHPLVLEPETIESISFLDLRTRLAPLKKWLDGVCVSGGEPTLAPGLIPLLDKLKEDGWAVKLDTNGSRPGVLKNILSRGLVDMVSMDVKAPLIQQKYERCTGTKVNLDDIRQSIALLAESDVEHEFRMTVLPLFHSEQDIIEWAKTLEGKGHLKLQNFNPKTTLNPEFASEKGFSPDVFAKFQAILAS